MPTTEDHKAPEVYELSYLVLPSIPEDGLADVVNSIKGIIKKEGGKELDSEDPIHLDLAYTMSKTVSARKYVVNDAYLGWVKFEAEPSVAPLVKAGVEKLEEVLRHLLVKAPRETHFTFAAARQAQMDAEAAKRVEEQGGEPELPAETVVEVVE